MPTTTDSRLRRLISRVRVMWSEITRAERRAFEMRTRMTARGPARRAPQTVNVAELEALWALPAYGTTRSEFAE